jgi:hypothetical protein
VWSFGTFFPVLVCCIKKNLATLAEENLARENVREFGEKKMWIRKRRRGNGARVTRLDAFSPTVWLLTLDNFLM